MGLLVRSWNLFHGNACPPGGGSHLRTMVRLASADRPAVLCLQELPLWSFRCLAAWSGMTVVADAAAPARVGPLPSTPEVGRRLTSLASTLLRSAFTGQGNAILLGAGISLLGRDVVVLNERRFRRAQAGALRLPALARLAWAKERRICQAARVELPDGRRALIANLHATDYGPDRRVPDVEVERAAGFVDRVASGADLAVLAGDFNVAPGSSRTLPALLARGYSQPGPWIDHVLVRGAPAGRLRVWPPARRTLDGRLLSDHAPVELEVA